MTKLSYPGLTVAHETQATLDRRALADWRGRRSVIDALAANDAEIARLQVQNANLRLRLYHAAKSTPTSPPDSYDVAQERLLRHFANREADEMDVEAMAWAVQEIDRLRALSAGLHQRLLLAISEVHSGAQAEGHQIIDAVLKVLQADAMDLDLRGSKLAPDDLAPAGKATRAD